jgi:hypothetical protein
MRKFVLSGLAAGVIGGAMMLSGSAPASAATLPSFALATPGDSAVVEKVQRSRRDRRARRYDRRHHGPRYSYARPGFRHFYGGHYYSSPWWYGPSIGFGLTVPFYNGAPGYGGGYGGSSSHVQWCMNRYRTYDPSSDTYIPRVGQRAYCNSPFN